MPGFIDAVNGRHNCVSIMMERHTESLEVARALAGGSEQFVSGLEVDAANQDHIIPVCLFIRQISCFRALLLLAVNGFYTEAIGHQRTLMEALARIAALHARPTLIRDYLGQDFVSNKRLLEDILSFRADWDEDIPRDPPDDEIRARLAEVRALLADYRQQSGREARDIKTFAWAEVGGVAHLLYGRYVISSEALHFSPKSLDHLVVDTAQGVHILIGPEDRDLNDLMLTSCKYVFTALQLVAGILDVAVPQEIEDLYQRFEQLHDRVATEALERLNL